MVQFGDIAFYLQLIYGSLLIESMRSTQLDSIRTLTKLQLTSLLVTQLSSILPNVVIDPEPNITLANISYPTIERRTSIEFCLHRQPYLCCRELLSAYHKSP